MNYAKPHQKGRAREDDSLVVVHFKGTGKEYVYFANRIWLAANAIGGGSKVLVNTTSSANPYLTEVRVTRVIPDPVASGDARYVENHKRIAGLVRDGKQILAPEFEEWPSPLPLRPDDDAAQRWRELHKNLASVQAEMDRACGVPDWMLKPMAHLSTPHGPNPFFERFTSGKYASSRQAARAFHQRNLAPNENDMADALALGFAFHHYTYPQQEDDTMLTITTQTLINGKNADAFTEDQLFDLLLEQHAKLEQVEKIAGGGHANATATARNRAKALRETIDKLGQIIDEKAKEEAARKAGLV